MIKAAIALTFGILISIAVILIDDFETISHFYFYVLIIFLMLSVVRLKTISLIVVWNAAFLFVICAEAISPNFIIVENTLSAFKLLLLGNNLITIGYYTIPHKNNKDINHVLKTARVPSFIPNLIFLLLAVLFIGSTIKVAIDSIFMGRMVAAEVNENNVILDAIVGSIGYILPATVAYFDIILNKKKAYIPLLKSLPIFILLLFLGSRFRLLFSVLGFVVVLISSKTGNIKFRDYIKYGLMIFVLASSAALMRNFRSGNVFEQVGIETKSKKIGYHSLPEYLSQYLSPEGVISMISLEMRHFKSHPYMLGANSSFLLYFYIPRSIWPDKPTMLGHWLLRKYQKTGFAAGHSSSYGFIGELYADFGWFSLFFVFLLGRLMGKGEKFRKKAFAKQGYKVVLATMLYPYVFFFVRSPITATMNFIGILVVYNFFYFFIFRKIMIEK
jgi:oligosaccharide repeat unit polymerase